MSMIKELGQNTFLYKDGSGWCGVAIGEFRGRASYIVDAPFDFLRPLKCFVDNKTVPVICCDEEGSEFKIVVDEFNTYIIIEREKTELFVSDITRKTFVATVINDIEENLDWFACDFADDPTDTMEVLQRKIDMLTIIKYLKEHLEEF